jgi:hypothetical protein
MRDSLRFSLSINGEERLADTGNQTFWICFEVNDAYNVCKMCKLLGLPELIN